MRPSLFSLYRVTFLAHQLFLSVVGDGIYGSQITTFNHLICNSVAMCATSSPFSSLSLSSSTECTMKCHFGRYRPASCIGFNFRPDNGSCEIYISNPSSFRMNEIGCHYSQAASTNSVDCSTVKVENNCAVDRGGCDVQAICSKSIGNLITCRCNVGFTGNGFICADINECLANNGGCSAQATCINSLGSFNCQCQIGYQGNGFTCADINECLTNNVGCSAQANCINSQGSFNCQCRTGYQGDGFTCTDIDECLTNSGGCSTTSTCVNLLGSFYCLANTWDNFARSMFGK